MNKADYIYRTKKKLERMERTIMDMKNDITRFPVIVKMELIVLGFASYALKK